MPPVPSPRRSGTLPPADKQDDNIDDHGRRSDGKVLDQPGAEHLPDLDKVQTTNRPRVRPDKG